MHVVADTVDDLMRRIIDRLLKHGAPAAATRGGFREVVGAMLKLKNPRARLSVTERKGTLFSCLGELLWYLSASDDLDFIRYYIRNYSENSDDGRTLQGAYGPRLFLPYGGGQVDRAIKLLKENRTSRRAAIQLYQDSDLSVKRRFKDVPCTCTLQLILRNNRLTMLAYLRSNDAFLGLPHDIFAFTMLQELIARSLSVELGHYVHCVGSLHLYDKNAPAAREYLDEGWQETLSMPRMPHGDPWHRVRSLLEVESALRTRQTEPDKSDLEPYWQDIVLLLRALSLYRRAKSGESTSGTLLTLKDRVTFNGYHPYIEQLHYSSLPSSLGRDTPYETAPTTRPK